MPRSLILETVTRAAFPTVIVFSLYLLFAGHNAPGGGFIGGLVAGAALVLRYLGRGAIGVRELVPVPFEALLAVGLLVAGGTGAAAWAFDEPFLSSGAADLHVPVLGDIHLVSALAFDVGVYCIVVGLVLGILTVLGDPPTRGYAGQATPDVTADTGTSEPRSGGDAVRGVGPEREVAG